MVSSAMASVGRCRSWNPTTKIQLMKPNLVLYSSWRAGSTLPKLRIFDAIAQHDPKKVAIIHSISGRQFTYGQLLEDVATAKEELINLMPPGQALEGQRVGFLMENSYDYVGRASNCACSDDIRKYRLTIC